MSDETTKVGGIGEPAAEITAYRVVGVVFENQQSGVGIEMRTHETGPLLRLDLTTPVEAHDFVATLARAIADAWPELRRGPKRLQ